MSKLLLYLSFSLLLITYTAAYECSFTPDDGCTVSKNTVLLPGTYPLSKGISITGDNLALDCNGAVLLGNGTGVGIKVYGQKSNITLKNCNFLNLSKGVLLNFDYTLLRYQRGILILNNNFTYNSNGINAYGLHTAYITGAEIAENTFIDNQYGIILGDNAINSSVHDNLFINSTLHLESNAAKNNVWGNRFVNKGITYKSTNNLFCKEGIPNNYSNALGPECDCLIAFSGLTVNSDALLCKKTYNLSDGLFLMGKLDCNGASIVGKGSGDGVAVLQEQSDYVIKGCNISNFTNGIKLWFKYDNTRYQNNGLIISNKLFHNFNGIYSEGQKKGWISNTNITNNLFFGDVNAISLKGNVVGSEVHNNLFINNSLNLIDYTTYNVSAQGNYWGSINASVIAGKLYDSSDNNYYGSVNFQPFLANITDIYVAELSYDRAVIHRDALSLIESAASIYLLRKGKVVLENNVTLQPFIGDKNIDIELNLEENDIIVVEVREEGEVNLENNVASIVYHRLPFVYVSSALRPLAVNKVVKEYIEDNLKWGHITEDASKADILVHIGKDELTVSQSNYMTLNLYGWGYLGNVIVTGNKQSRLPYHGLYGSFVDGKRHVFLYGNRIEGDIAAVKTFIKNQTGQVHMVSDIAVYDFLHLDENIGCYGKDNEEFPHVVKAALYDEMFTTEDKTVYSDGVMLRLREIKPAHSPTYLAYKDTIGLPIVLARGLWSNLSSWSSFGGELANSGRDVWLIEITGGPGQDCSACVNYDYSDLTDSYVPALLNKVLDETGKEKIQYVGFSNGCRAALSSLEKGKFDPDKVETFVGIGCPGAFEGYSTYSNYFKIYSNGILEQLRNESHVSGPQLGSALMHNCHTTKCRLAAKSLELMGGSLISFNLANDYLSWIQATNDSQPGIKISLNRFLIINGKINGLISDIYDENNSINQDLMVPLLDGSNIFEGISSSSKYHYAYFGMHGGPNSLHLAEKSLTRSLVSSFLSNKSIGAFEIYDQTEAE